MSATLKIVIGLLAVTALVLIAVFADPWWLGVILGLAVAMLGGWILTQKDSTGQHQVRVGDYFEMNATSTGLAALIIGVGLAGWSIHSVTDARQQPKPSQASVPGPPSANSSMSTATTPPSTPSSTPEGTTSPTSTTTSPEVSAAGVGPWKGVNEGVNLTVERCFLDDAKRLTCRVHIDNNSSEDVGLYSDQFLAEDDLSQTYTAADKVSGGLSWDSDDPYSYPQYPFASSTTKAGNVALSTKITDGAHSVRLKFGFTTESDGLGEKHFTVYADVPYPPA